MREHPPSTGRLDLDSSWGVIRIRAADGEVVSCRLPALRLTPASRFAWRHARLAARDPETARLLRQAGDFVRHAMRGKAARPPRFRLPPAAPFTRRVWRELLRIPRGSTLTYGGLAKRMGSPQSARAVGRACGANPLPLFIPCHRVVAGDGSHGGFSSGMPWKKLLLERERFSTGGKGAGPGSSRRSRSG